MQSFLLDWLNLLLRWSHFVVGVGWIGTSFYFIWLDLSLRRRADMRDGVAGTSWLVHGGGFYQVEKYGVAPEALPEDLHWFKWEAYLTWVTGFALLAVQYYLNASTYLIDRAVLDLSPWQAISISIVTLAAGWFVYDLLCRSPIGRNMPVLALALFLLVVGSAWFFGQVFSGRGAFIHVGALVGTIMAANVFAVIIPGQKKMTAAMIAGDAPDPEYGRIGQQRSMHNNYLTLPVLVMMISNHYPMLYAHGQGWLVVALILVLGALVRHFINRADAGDPLRGYGWSLPVAAVALVAAIFLTSPDRRGTTAEAAAISEESVLDIVATHCQQCHAAAPTHEAFDAAPGGVRLETPADLRRHADRVLTQAVDSHAMPLGNETGMTEEERAMLGAWLEGR